MSANISSNIVKEGESVSFTCSAKGQPEPAFTWTKHGRDLHSQANWTISSINASQSGSYACEAKNKHGSEKSVVTVEVICEYCFTLIILIYFYNFYNFLANVIIPECLLMFLYLGGLNLCWCSLRYCRCIWHKPLFLMRILNFIIF